MKEIEVKVLEQKHELLEERLKSIGARKVFEGELVAIFYELKNPDEILRIRREGDKTYLTHKGDFVKDSFKSATETEVEVSDFDVMRTLLEKLGYSEVKVSKKKRISYKYGRIKFEFDKLLGEDSFVPEFLEIEAENEKDLYLGVNMLGFKKSDCTNFGRKEIVKYYREKL